MMRLISLLTVMMLSIPAVDGKLQKKPLEMDLNMAMNSKLLEKATLVKQGVRRTSNYYQGENKYNKYQYYNRNYEGEDAEEYDAGYSLSFDSCVSMTAEPESDVLFSDDLIKYAKSGKILSQKSFVLFRVCETRYCTYSADESVYVIPMEDYMDAVSSFQSNRESNYCSACQDSYDYCAYKRYSNAQAYSSYSSNNNNGGNRFLYNNNERPDFSNMKLVDCSTCLSMGCIVTNENDYYATKEETVTSTELMDDLAGCMQTEAYFDQPNYYAQKTYNEDGQVEYEYEYSYPLYAGFMCNSNGNGVDVAMFLDNSCSIQDTRHSFGDSATQEQLNVYKAAKSLANYPVSNTISCNGELEYIGYSTYQKYKRTYGYFNNKNSKSSSWGQASDFCENLIGSGEALEDCYDEQRAYYRDKKIVYHDYDYYWLQYLLPQNGDGCEVIAGMQSEYSTVYVWNGQIVDNNGRNPYDKNKNKTSPFKDYDTTDWFMLIAMTGGLVALLTAGTCMAYSCYQVRKKEKHQNKKRAAHGAYQLNEDHLVDQKNSNEFPQDGDTVATDDAP